MPFFGTFTTELGLLFTLNMKYMILRAHRVTRSGFVTGGGRAQKPPAIAASDSFFQEELWAGRYAILELVLLSLSYPGPVWVVCLDGNQPSAPGSIYKQLAALPRLFTPGWFRTTKVLATSRLSGLVFSEVSPAEHQCKQSQGFNCCPVYYLILRYNHLLL